MVSTRTGLARSCYSERPYLKIEGGFCISPGVRQACLKALGGTMVPHKIGQQFSFLSSRIGDWIIQGGLASLSSPWTIIASRGNVHEQNYYSSAHVLKNCRVQTC